jgi:flagellar motor switch protein FliN/FliY
MKLGYVKDVMVPLQVVLGGTSKSLREVADISPGIIIELDRLAGEPLDLVAAGEVIAKGEVVVIDENFGIRVTGLVEKEPRP